MLSRISRLRNLSRRGLRIHSRNFNSSPLSALSNGGSGNAKDDVKLSAIVASAFLVSGTAALTLFNEKRCEAEPSHSLTTPVTVNVNPSESIEEDAKDPDKLPIYTSNQVAQNNGQDGKSTWMSYGGIVYDVTDFIANHPGGSERILQAAGGPVEPYWHLYRQHFASDLPMQLMEDLVIGTLDENDQEAIDEQMAKMVEENEDPYAHEPTRSELLIVHGDQPMNAEVPGEMLTSKYLTSSELFYIRHHHPVPILMQKEIDNFELEIDLSEFANSLGLKDASFKMTMEELKKLPKVEVVATLQCSGNRRGDMNSVKRTSGTSWSQGAISTAKWGGVRLTDVLKAAGVEDPIALTEKGGIQKHLRMESLDGMKASINMEKATNPYGDVIIAYEMNDEALPRDHGFPLRVIVPGFAAVRNVKWLKKIEISDSEAEGTWQQGLNYKTLPPNVTDAKNVDLRKMPSMTEVAVFSGITTIDLVGAPKLKPGKTIMVKTKGWAWAGGGRNIVRVDITGDGGNSWQSAEIKEGGEQRFGRAWAWIFWECEVPAVVKKDGTVELASKAVDLAFNSQPETVAPAWNVRGLGNNSWHRASTRG
jgi:sulfite oxidase